MPNCISWYHVFNCLNRKFSELRILTRTCCIYYCLFDPCKWTREEVYNLKHSCGHSAFQISHVQVVQNLKFQSFVEQGSYSLDHIFLLKMHIQLFSSLDNCVQLALPQNLMLKFNNLVWISQLLGAFYIHALSHPSCIACLVLVGT